MPLTDKDIAQDLLNAQKMSTQTYNTLAYESSNENLKRDVLNILHEEHLMHTQVFNYMNQRGWYEPRPADRNDIQLLASKIANAVNVSGVGAGVGAGAGMGAQWGGGPTPGGYAYGGFGQPGGGGGGYMTASPTGGFSGWTGTGATQVPNPMSVSLPESDQVRAQNVNYGGQQFAGGGGNVNWATGGTTGATGTGNFGSFGNLGNYGQQGRLSEGIMRI